MIVYVQRDGNGAITGTFANPQPGRAEEAIDNQAAEVVAFLAANNKIASPSLVDGATFLGRVTDNEYASILTAAQSNVAVARWIELLRMKGSINLNDKASQDAKAGLVALGLLTQDRANVIFAP